MVGNKKASIILILRVLEEYSDENHFLTQKEIIDRVERDYGLALERKSVAFSLSLLEELGYDIMKSPRGGFALYSRLFEPSEATFINDALFSSRAITGKQAIALSDKVNSTFSKYGRKKHPHLLKSAELSRTDNLEVFYNINLIEEGIERGKRVSFQLRTYDEEGKPVLRYDGYRYIVSPYYLINNYGRYYCLCNYRSKYRPLQVFRLDYMLNMQIEEEWDLIPLDKLEGAEGFDIAKYMNEHVYLLGGETVDAVVRIENPNSILYLFDWFGKNAKVRKEGDALLAHITCNEESLFYWILQYGQDFTLLSPEPMVERLKTHILSQTEKYGENKNG